MIITCACIRASDETLSVYTILDCFFLFQIQSAEGLTISKEGSFHRLKIHKVTEEFAGTYKFEADGRKTEAVIAVEGINIFLAEITWCIMGLHY